MTIFAMFAPCLRRLDLFKRKAIVPHLECVPPFFFLLISNVWSFVVSLWSIYVGVGSSDHDVQGGERKTTGKSPTTNVRGEEAWRRKSIFLRFDPFVFFQCIQILLVFSGEMDNNPIFCSGKEARELGSTRQWWTWCQQESYSLAWLSCYVSFFVCCFQQRLFEQQMSEERRRFEQYREEEMKKIKREKRVAERQLKSKAGNTGRKYGYFFSCDDIFSVLCSPSLDCWYAFILTTCYYIWSVLVYA